MWAAQEIALTSSPIQSQAREHHFPRDGPKPGNESVHQIHQFAGCLFLPLHMSRACLAWCTDVRVSRLRFCALRSSPRLRVSCFVSRLFNLHACDFTSVSLPCLGTNSGVASKSLTLTFYHDTAYTRYSTRTHTQAPTRPSPVAHKDGNSPSHA